MNDSNVTMQCTHTVFRTPICVPISPVFVAMCVHFGPNLIPIRDAFDEIHRKYDHFQTQQN